jgi:hypothetical protein
MVKTTFGKKNKAARKIQAAVRGAQARSRRNTPRAISRPSNPTFGNVSTINTAPVAIGNSLRGFKSQVVHAANGCRIVGRDYGFSPAATGTVTGWALTGGMPLTPACMPSTALRNFVQMYNRFKINKLVFHYITSSSTATTGDVMFYFQKSSASSNVNWTSSSFLPYVLSDSETVIGPQWTNHSITINPTGPFRRTDYGMNLEAELDSFGDLFLYSKTSSTESPGYCIMDYDITFKELSVNPRAGLLPTIKAQWQPVSFVTSGAKTAGSTALSYSSLSTTFIGATTITNPVLVSGEVYQFVIDATNSTFSAATAANFLVLNNQSTTTALTLTDGFTCYINPTTAAAGYFYPNQTAAVTATTLFLAGATVTYAETIRGYIKLIGWEGGAAVQNSY